MNVNVEIFIDKASSLASAITCYDGEGRSGLSLAAHSSGMIKL